MNIAIVDDMLADRTRLINDIKKYAGENAMLVCMTEYQNGEEFLSSAQLTTLDAVFLDIYMGELSGMEVAHQIHKLYPSCQIVFVATSSAFAVQSYEVRAFYYILKPYEYGDIVRVMSMLDQNLQKSSRYIKVKEGREWRKILLSDIIYVDYSNHYVQIHTEDVIISTYMNFPEMAEKLSGYNEFLNCYRCIIVNLNKIQKIDEMFFLLCNGEYIPINRKRAKEIKACYVDYIFGTLEEGAI